MTPGPCGPCSTCGLDWPRYVFPPNGCGVCGHAACPDASQWRKT